MYLAIDIGGTKTLLGLFNWRGKKLKSVKFATDQDPELFITYLKDHLDSLLLGVSRSRIKAIVCSYPGVIIHGQPQSAPNLAAWDGTYITRCIKNLFTNYRVECPIFYQNDANLAALYECHNLSGTNIFLTFSTGIGGGIVFHNQLTSDSLTFEPGHHPYVYQNQSLEWEQIASSRAIRLAYNIPDVTRIRQTDILKDIALRVSLGLPDIINQYHPRTIIIGGPLGATFPRFRTYLIRLLKSSLPSDTQLPRLTSSKRPQESVIYGCYLYAKDQLRQH